MRKREDSENRRVHFAPALWIERGENDHSRDTNLKVFFFFEFWVIYVGWMMGISRQIGLQIDTRTKVHPAAKQRGRFLTHQYKRVISGML